MTDEQNDKDIAHQILDALLKIAENTGSTTKQAERQLRGMKEDQQLLDIARDAVRYSRAARCHGCCCHCPTTDWAKIAEALGYNGSAL